MLKIGASGTAPGLQGDQNSVESPLSMPGVSRVEKPRTLKAERGGFYDFHPAKFAEVPLIRQITFCRVLLRSLL